MDRSMERRQGDRRQVAIACDRDLKFERRRANRRRLMRAGMLALIGAAGAKAHVLRQTNMLSDPAAVSVDVSEDHRLQQEEQTKDNDRAMLEAYAAEAAEVYGVSPELVMAVIQIESGFDPEAVSPVGARGPMQIMPRTAKFLGITDPHDARQNIFGGTKYLSSLLERFNGNTALALAGYNAGPTVVARLKGIPPYSETRGYVRKIHKLLADTDAAFTMPAPKVRAKGKRVLKSRTVMSRSGLKDKRAKVSRASVTRKPVKSSKGKAIKAKAPARRAPSGSRA